MNLEVCVNIIKVVASINALLGNTWNEVAADISSLILCYVHTSEHSGNSTEAKSLRFSQ